jgi:hypothetical protein
MKNVQKHTSLLERQISCANLLAEKSQKISIDTNTKLKEKHVIFYKNIEDENQKRSPIMKTTIKITRMVAIAALIGSTATIANADQSWGGWFSSKAKNFVNNLSTEKVKNFSEKALKVFPAGKEIFDAVVGVAEIVQDNKNVIHAVKNLAQGNILGAVFNAGEAAYQAYNEKQIGLDDVVLAKNALKQSTKQIDSKSGSMPAKTTERIESAKEMLELYNKQQRRQTAKKAIKNIASKTAKLAKSANPFGNVTTPFENAK